MHLVARSTNTKFKMRLIDCSNELGDDDLGGGRMQMKRYRDWVGLSHHPSQPIKHPYTTSRNGLSAVTVRAFEWIVLILKPDCVAPASIRFETRQQRGDATRRRMEKKKKGQPGAHVCFINAVHADGDKHFCSSERLEKYRHGLMDIDEMKISRCVRAWMPCHHHHRRAWINLGQHSC